MVKPSPRTTDAIIKDLTDNRDARLEAGEQVDVRAIQQEITAHQELARLRAKHAERVAAKDWASANDLLTQIQHWVRFVTEDVEDAPKTVPADPAPPADPKG